MDSAHSGSHNLLKTLPKEDFRTATENGKNNGMSKGAYFEVGQ